jgi:2-dehydropantoate 2-reductase
VIAQVQQNGLRLRLGQREHRLKNVQIFESLDEAFGHGPFDAAMVAVKSFDTQNFIDGISAYWRDLPPLISFQNGVENEAMLASALGADRVIAASVTTAIGKGSNGEIILEKLRGIGFASDQPIVDDLMQVFQAAGLKPMKYACADSMKWSKMLTNVIANASSAILDMTPAQIYATPSLYRMEIMQLRELLKVMAAMHIEVTDLPGTPVRLLARAIQFLSLAISQPLLTNAVGGGRGEKMPSFHIDLHQGRGRSEVDYLNGAVVRYGKKYNVPTPVNQFYNETLLAISEGRLPIETFDHQPEAFIKAAQ